MTYEEAIEATVTKAEAKHCIEVEHQVDEGAWAEFLQEHGDHEEYSGGDVLGFLGY